MSEYIIVRKPKRRRHRDSEETNISLADIYREKKEELDGLDKFIKEQEELNKKEDKKAEGYKFTFVEGMLLAFMAQYFLGPILHTGLKAYGVQ